MLVVVQVTLRTVEEMNSMENACSVEEVVNSEN